MKFVVFLVLLTLTSCASVSVPQVPGGPPPAAPERQFAIYIGQRSLDQDLWSPVEDQGVFGIEYAQESTNSYVGWEVGLTGSTDDNGPFTGSTGELYAGIRKSFGNDSVRPYIGGGIAFINAEAEAGSVSEDDSSVAAYLHGGLQFLVSPTFFLAIDIRGLFGSDISIAGVDGDADYGQAALAFGWRF